MKRTFLLLAITMLCGSACLGQLSQKGNPFISPNIGLKSSVKAVKIDRPNIDSLLNLVPDTDKKRSIAAIAQLIDKDFMTMGTSWDNNNGGQVIELALQTPDATGLIVHFSEFYLPPGAKVYVYNETAVLGAYTYLNNKKFGSLTIQELPGKNLTIQLYIPDGKKDQVKLRLGNIGYGFKSTAVDIYYDGFGQSLPCNHDINSEMGMFHQKEKRSVVAMTHLEYQFYVRYSAVLVNNYNNDGTPYFLTAKHCFEKVFTQNEFHPEYAESAVAHFGYESASPGVNGDWTKTISGAEILCYDPSEELGYFDFVLIRFSEAPPESYNPLYAGIKGTVPEINIKQEDTNSLRGNSTFTTIHHPKGDVKKITWYERVSRLNNSNILLRDSYGLTEGGSSGCPLFDDEHYVIGVLNGGSFERECNTDFINDYADDFAIVSYAYTFFPELKQYLFGQDGEKKIWPYEPYSVNDRLMFYPNSLKIDLGEEKLICENTSTGNYSDFRWDFGEGAESRYYEGIHPPEVELQELGYYTVTLTALNSRTGQDETFTCENVIQSRYGVAYPLFYVSNQKGRAGYNFVITDTLYINNISHGAADGFVIAIGGNSSDTIEVNSVDETVIIPPFDMSEFADETELLNGKQIAITMLQKHPEKDSLYTRMIRIHQPTIAAFEFERTNPFNRDISGDYYLINETEIIATGKSTGSLLSCRWYVNGELKYEGRRNSIFSFLPTEKGNYELKLVASNDFSADSVSFEFDFHLTTAIDDIKDNDLKVWPTACKEQIIIQSADILTMDMFSITGKKEQAVLLQAGNNTVNVTGLVQGIYLLRFTGDNGQHKKTIKIVKQ